jgi:hypothetical protein
MKTEIAQKESLKSPYGAFTQGSPETVFAEAETRDVLR